MNIDKLISILSDKGCKQIYVKVLSENDNSKNQVYFGGNFEVLNILPFKDLQPDVSGKHKLEGIGTGFVPSICRLDLADEIVQVTDHDAAATARRLAKMEGIFGGISSGANVWAGLNVPDASDLVKGS